MSQQHPQPYPTQQPGWTPPPPKKSSAGKIIGFGCLGVIGLFIVLGIIGAIATSSNDNKSTDTSASSSTPTAKEQGTPKEEGSDSAGTKEEEPAKKAAIAVTAKKTAFAKSIIAEDSDYTSVSVTITNNSGKSIDVNPLYVTITDTGGTKHTAELAVDENQLDTVTLAPGENITGAITGKGAFTPKYVTYTDGLLGESTRADVS